MWPQCPVQPAVRQPPASSGTAPPSSVPWMSITAGEVSAPASHRPGEARRKANNSSVAEHMESTMKAHHASLRKTRKRHGVHPDPELRCRSQHGCFDDRACGDRTIRGVGKIEPLPSGRIHRTGIGSIGNKEGRTGEPQRHRIGQIGQIIGISTPAMHDHNKTGCGTTPCRGVEMTCQIAKGFIIVQPFPTRRIASKGYNGCVRLVYIAGRPTCRFRLRPIRTQSS